MEPYDPLLKSWEIPDRSSVQRLPWAQQPGHRRHVLPQGVEDAVFRRGRLPHPVLEDQRQPRDRPRPRPLGPHLCYQVHPYFPPHSGWGRCGDFMSDPKQQWCRGELCACRGGLCTCRGGTVQEFNPENLLIHLQLSFSVDLWCAGSKLPPSLLRADTVFRDGSKPFVGNFLWTIRAGPVNVIRGRGEERFLVIVQKRGWKHERIDGDLCFLSWKQPKLVAKLQSGESPQSQRLRGQLLYSGRRLVLFILGNRPGNCTEVYIRKLVVNIFIVYACESSILLLLNVHMFYIILSINKFLQISTFNGFCVKMKHFEVMRRWHKKLGIELFRQATHSPWSCHILFFIH